MNNQPEIYTILVAEDSEEDFITFKRLLKKLSFPYRVFRCRKGEEILDFLYQRKAFAEPGTSVRPSLILLDLNLIGLDGRVVLSRIKGDPLLKRIPVVVFTTSASTRDIDLCYQEGASGYLLKPLNLDRYTEELKGLLNYWFETVMLPEPEK